ncbi:ChrR family anti-sigma-E factor [Marinagarivorans algicola]|uniref:ChrR family anti-sigma-E factor n=1 Tax=Marinagarivorans algicola TaxID=1513270 RepID=UPI0006B5B08A|nr:ChrR family anti-sigma-E factor [Marinagarivorans algicola]
MNHTASGRSSSGRPTLSNTSSSPAIINHHPDANMLVEYASGSLPWGLSIAVSAHLQLCQHCQQQHAKLSALGGSCLNDAPKEAVNDDAFSRLLSNIDKASTPAEDKVIEHCQQTAAQTLVNAKRAGINAEHLPRVVKKLLPPQLRWQKISNALKSARLITGQGKHEVAFHKISKGGKVVEHDHRGLEVTLVLEGSFSDEEGIYCPGDFLVREPGQVHRPTASQNQDCLCLSVCEAPVKVTGLLGTLLNPFLSIQPA